MRWLLPAFLLLSLAAKAQTVGRLIDFLARETSQQLDILAYKNPEFRWNMDGRVQAFLNEGINYLDEKKPGLALPELEKGIELAPRLWVLHYYRGVCLKQLHRYRDAVDALKTADSLNPNQYLVLIELGKANDLCYQWNIAEKNFKSAVKLNPNSALPLYFLGNHYVDVNNLLLAKRTYRRAVELDSMSLDAEVKLGLIVGFERAKNNEKIILKYVNKVLRKESTHQQALLVHGMIMFEDSVKQSLKDWDALVRLNPSNSSLRMMRGLVRTELGMFDEAFSDIRKYIESLGTDENTFTGKQTFHDKLINLTYAGYYVVANVYGLPDEDAARVRQAYCNLFNEQYNKSIAALATVKNGNKSALILFLQALTFEHKKDHQKAFLAYNECLKLDNDIIDAHKKRGIYFSELEQWDKATADFNEMLRINSETYHAYKLRGVSRFHQNDFRGAIADFTKYLVRDSSDQEAWGSRGASYARVKDVLSATHDFCEQKNIPPLPQKILSSGDWMHWFQKATLQKHIGGSTVLWPPTNTMTWPMR